MTRRPESTTQPSDEDLVERARAGDRDAVTELCARYRTPLVHFCYRYLGGRDAGEDAAQEVLMRVAVEQRWPSGTFRAWIYRIAHNHCIDEQRRIGKGLVGYGTLFGASRLVSPRTGPPTAFDRRERDERLRTALAAMPSDLADVLTLRYFENLTRKEIGCVLELSESTVKERLAQARQEMARKLDAGNER